MKLVCCLLGLMVCLSGCSTENREIQEAMEVRDALLSAQGCSFQAAVTADYGDSVSGFSMDCQADAAGNLSFEITEPDSISGIRGRISDSGGSIDFEDQALYFPLLTDDLLTPASAPWIFLKTLRSGYLTSACTEEGLLHITVDDSFAEDALMLDIWLMDGTPVRADILCDSKRILSVEVENFRIL